MSYQQNHLFIDEPAIKNINKQLTVQHYQQLNHYIVVHPPTRWYKSSVNLFTINTNIHQKQPATKVPTIIPSSLANFHKQITFIPCCSPFSFLFNTSNTNTSLIKFTFLICLFIFFYHFFSSSIYSSHSSLKSSLTPSTPPSPSIKHSFIPRKRMASDTCKSSFDVDKVCSCLKKYNEDPNASSLDLYIEAYKELQKFFECLGSVFSFVTSDVESKINILVSYRNDPKYGDDYATLQSMMEYEAKHNLLRKEDRPSGARTLLRLHRALAFISKFIMEVSKLEDSAATSTAARSAYQATLAKYHPWVIRKTAALAMYGLPNREQLIIRAFGGEGANQDKFTATMINLAELSETTYNITNKLYEDNNLLDLP